MDFTRWFKRNPKVIHPLPPKTRFDDCVPLSAVMRKCIREFHKAVDKEGVTISDQQVVLFSLVFTNLVLQDHPRDLAEREAAIIVKDVDASDDLMNQMGID